jgi:hypothetical protein
MLNDYFFPKREIGSILEVLENPENPENPSVFAKSNPITKYIIQHIW